MQFSVLMSLYEKENPNFLYESLKSVFEQTLRPNEVILVEDGPIPQELEIVVNKFQRKYPTLKVVPLKENSGLGNALNVGLRFCSFDIVIRMDTDDICFSDRFEKQISFLESHSDIDVLSSWILEFIGDKKNTINCKKLPEKHEDIIKYSKKRCPINHPSAVYKKHKVLECGGYGPFPEDYYLWAKMIMNGCKFYNIQDNLLYFRSSDNVYRRRGGWNYFIAMSRLQIFLYKINFLSGAELFTNLIIRSSVSLLPNFIRKAIYTRFLRQ